MTFLSRLARRLKEVVAVADVRPKAFGSKPAESGQMAPVPAREEKPAPKPVVPENLPSGIKAANEVINTLPPVTHPAFDRAALKVSPSLATPYAADCAIVDARLARDNCAATSIGLDRPRHTFADFGIPVARTSGDGAVVGRVKGVLGSIAPIKIARAVIQRVAVFVTNNRAIRRG